MKKLLSLLVVLVMLISALPCSAEINTSVFLKAEELNELYTLIDKIEFEFIVEDFLGEYFQENIADLGQTVNAKLEHYGNRTWDYYLLTVNGNVGEVCFWTSAHRGLDSSSSLFSNNIPLTFFSNTVVENGNLITYGGDIQLARYYLKTVFSDNNLNTVALKHELSSTNIVGWNNIENVVEGKNIRYEVVEKTDNTLSDNFEEKDKESIIEEQIKENEKYDVEEQDPERYVTKVKGERNDGKILGYKISFIAEIPINNFNSNADWYKKLGDNVTATLVGFTQTLDNKEIRNYTMIRFVGSKNTVWFDNADTLPRKTNNGVIEVDNSYVSLISFNGIEQIYNSVNHNTLDTKITFNDSEEMELVSIQLIIGGKLIKTDINDIKYIGGGKATYEKLF